MSSYVPQLNPGNSNCHGTYEIVKVIRVSTYRVPMKKVRHEGATEFYGLTRFSSYSVRVTEFICSNNINLFGETISYFKNIVAEILKVFMSLNQVKSIK